MVIYHKMGLLEMFSLTAKPWILEQILQQAQIFHPQPLDKEQFELFLAILSPKHLPTWDAYEILSGINREKYNVINRSHSKEFSWDDFMKETNACNEKRRNEMYKIQITSFTKQ